jgi:hypothetical protein
MACEKSGEQPSLTKLQAAHNFVGGDLGKFLERMKLQQSNQNVQRIP